MAPRRSQPGKKTDAAELRRQAEAEWTERKKKTGPLPVTVADLQRLVHELQVHQIELEMQNEELTQARAETEKALRYYNDLYDFAPAGYFTLARDGAVRQVNLSGARLLGVERKRLIKRRFGLFVSVESRQGFNAFLERVFECREELSCEVVLRRDGQEPRWAHIQASCTEDEQECRAVLVDITGRKRVEEELQIYKRIVSSTPDGIAFLDKEYHYLIVNDAYERFSGKPQLEFIGLTVAEYLGGSVFEKEIKPNFDRCLQGETIRFQEWFQYPQLGPRFVEVTYFPYLDAWDQIVGIVANTRDITERKRVEEALRTSEAQLSNALQMACASHWEYDVGSDTFTFNDNFYQIFRTTAEKVGGYKMSSADYARRFCHPDDMAIVSKETKAAIESTDPNYNCQLEHRILYADGEVGYITVRFFIVKDSQGRTVKTYGVNQDITARKREEEKLRASDALLRTVLSNVPITIFATDNQGVFTLSEGKGLERVGLSPGENVGVSALDLLASKPFVENTGRITTGQDVILRVLAGETVNAIDELNGVYFDNHIGPIHGAEGEVVGIVGVATDITERKQAQRDVAMSHSRLNEAQALSHTGNYEFEVPEGEVVWSNETFRIVARDPALGPLTIEECMALVHPQDREILSQVVAGTIASGKGFDIQFRVGLPDGEEKHIRSIGRVQKAGGCKDRIIGTIIDVSVQVRAQQKITWLLDSVTQQREELRLLAARISQAAETERRLIAAELHDQVGQSLTAMNINLNILRGQLLESAPGLVERVDDTLQMVDQTAVRIRDLMTQLRPSVLDDYGLFPALEAAAEQFTQRNGVPVSVSRQPAGGEITRLSADEETALFRIAQEALVNCARHAGAGQIKITLKMLKNKLRLVIADNGQGFSPEEIGSVKENGGWGLHIMRERAQAVGARLVVDSCPGEGTTVMVELQA